MIIKVNISPARKALAEKLGTTRFVNPKEFRGDIAPYLINLTK